MQLKTLITSITWCKSPYVSSLQLLLLLAFAFKKIQKLEKSPSGKATPSFLTSMPCTMIKPNGKNHTISSLKGLIPQTQSVLLLTTKGDILIPLALGLGEKGFVLERLLQKVQWKLLSPTLHRYSIWNFRTRNIWRINQSIILEWLVATKSILLLPWMNEKW